MPCVYRLEEPRYKLPETLLSSYEIVGVLDGKETVLERVENNRRRLIYHTVGQQVDAIRVVPLATWGAEEYRIFSLDVE